MHNVTHLGGTPQAGRPHHALAILLDHARARLIYLDDAPVDGGTIETDWSSRQFRVHDRHGGGGSGRAHPPSSGYFHAIADAIGHAARVVLAGPGSAKHELLAWLRQHASPLADRVAAVETVDRATDGELVALARRALHAEPTRMVWPRTETL
jgi:stalled ribosome rescue protein Dom34